MSNTSFAYKSGFTQVDNEIFYVQSAVSSSAFSLLLRIYRSTQGYGLAVKALSSSYLQKTTNLSKNTVTKAIRELEGLGLILVKRRSRLTSYYQVSVKGVSDVYQKVKDELVEEPDTLDLDFSEEVAQTEEVPQTEEPIKKESPEVMDTGFEIFWSIYDKEVGRSLVKAAWDKLRISDQKDIMKVLESYIKSTPDKSYRKDPINYLKGKVWLDEVVERAVPPVISAPNKSQQPPKFSAPEVEVRDVVKEGTVADAKIKDFLKNYGKKGSTYA